MAPPLKFGIYLAPFHPVRDNPTAALHRDLELIVLADSLGYDYAWTGEQHSAGFEIIASPEVFIAAAAGRTRQIRLGASLSSLPYQHPLIAADRIMLLDHLTRGRVAFGVGPGLLPSDAIMMGTDPADQSAMTARAIDAIVPLLRGETVTCHTDWFKLVDARLQLQPFSDPAIEMAVASQTSPAGARIAGTHGLGLLSLAATTPGGFDALAASWEIYERNAAENEQPVDRSLWTLAGPVHIASSRKQAMANVRHGIVDWVNYMGQVVGLAVAPPEGDPAQAMVDSGLAVIGSPRDAIAQIKRLQQASGGFGCFLQMAHNWADWPQTQASYEMFMRYVAPEFGKANEGRRASFRHAARNRTPGTGRETNGLHATEEQSEPLPGPDHPQQPPKPEAPNDPDQNQP